jgi:hypothetical protein
MLSAMRKYQIGEEHQNATLRFGADCKGFLRPSRNCNLQSGIGLKVEELWALFEKLALAVRDAPWELTSRAAGFLQVLALIAELPDRISRMDCTEDNRRISGREIEPSHCGRHGSGTVEGTFLALTASLGLAPVIELATPTGLVD